MSTIDELIREMCPDGVEYRRLEDICTIRNGYTPSRNKHEYWENGTVPWFRMDDIRMNGRELSESLQHVTLQAVKGQLFPAGSIIFATTATIGEHALITVPFLCNQQFTVLTVREELKESIDIRYLFHYGFIIDEWCRHNTKSGTMAAVDMNKFRKFTIPIPPLAVQQEVVRVLDTFTELTAELTTALKAEEGARKQQYAYYRDELLRLDGVEGVEWKKLGEIGKFYGGLTGKNKYDFDKGNALFATYKNVYANPALDVTLAETVNVLQGEKQNALAYGDIIFTGSSETPNECGLSSVVTEQLDDALYLNSFCFFLRPNDPDILLPDFAKHLFRSSAIRRQIVRTANGVTRFNVSKEKMKNVLVPIPPIEVQKDIASKLDAFSSYCDDLTSGLPAEIAVREKQYAYYRDKMLSFQIKR